MGWRYAGDQEPGVICLMPGHVGPQEARVLRVADGAMFCWACAKAAGMNPLDFAHEYEERRRVMVRWVSSDSEVQEEGRLIEPGRIECTRCFKVLYLKQRLWLSRPYACDECYFSETFRSDPAALGMRDDGMDEGTRLRVVAQGLGLARAVTESLARVSRGQKGLPRPAEDTAVGRWAGRLAAWQWRVRH